jgi:RimJ/RimL family protein N-acetyltransferase
MIRMSREPDDLQTWIPREHPSRETLTGELVRLEPLSAEHHAADLWEAAQGAESDPALWDWMGYGPFPDEQAFAKWVLSHTTTLDPLFFAVVDIASGKAQGMVSYLRIEPAHGVIEIGHIWFGGVLQRTRGATEAIYLLARHAFDDLGYRRLEWKCNAKNARSRNAALRFGFTFEGVFRQHFIVKGRNRDTAWFSIIDREWPAIRQGFEQWLDATNFDAAGVQKRSLADVRAG